MTKPNNLAEQLADSARLIFIFFFKHQKGTALHRELPLQRALHHPLLMTEACHHVLMGNQRSATMEWIETRADIRRNLTVLAKAAYRCWELEIPEWVYTRAYADLSWNPRALEISKWDRTMPILHEPGLRFVLNFMRADHVLRRLNSTTRGVRDNEHARDLILRDLMMLDNHVRVFHTKDPKLLIMQTARTLDTVTLLWLSDENRDFIRRLMGTLETRILEQAAKRPVVTRQQFNELLAHTVTSPIVKGLFE